MNKERSVKKTLAIVTLFSLLAAACGDNIKPPKHPAPRAVTEAK